MAEYDRRLLRENDPSDASRHSGQSKEELADRIYKYFEEVNGTPVVHHWKYKMDEIDPAESVTIGLAI